MCGKSKLRKGFQEGEDSRKRSVEGLSNESRMLLGGDSLRDRKSIPRMEENSSPETKKVRKKEKRNRLRGVLGGAPERI